MSSAKGRSRASLPRPCLIAISHSPAALMSITFSRASMSSRARVLNRVVAADQPDEGVCIEQRAHGAGSHVIAKVLERGIEVGGHVDQSFRAAELAWPVCTSEGDDPRHRLASLCQDHVV